MSSVDERIVEMRFDNQQFESGVQKSLKTLDQLKNGLHLEDSAKSLENLNQSAKSFDLSGIATGVDAVSQRVSALGIVGDQVIRYLTNQFIQLGEAAAQTVKSLTIDQVGAGFDKYERKIQSVQTIMNATGYSAEEVGERLNKLNWFTDETSYSFTDMVDNIGKFTSSNVDLDVAVTSMIGIADAAGLAGSSVNDASHAMEGFSKAIAQGYMSRQNWQWIRTAHMDTAQFKETLIDAAVEANTLIKKVGKDGKEIYETLDHTAVSVADFETGMKDGWLTTEAMTKALNKFGGATEDIYNEYLKFDGEVPTSDIIGRMAGNLDELGLKAFRASQEAKTFTDAINSVKDAVSTGWMTSFEYIFGNKDEAVALWTEVANEMWEVFASGGEARNEMLKEWHEEGGYKYVIDGIRNGWEGIKAISETVKETFSDIFPKVTADKLLNFSEKFNSITKSFKDNFIVPDKYLKFFEDPTWLARYEKMAKEGVLAEGALNALNAYKNLQKVKDAFGGIKSVINLAKFGFQSFGKILAPLAKLFKLNTSSVLDFAASIGKNLTKAIDSIITSESISGIIDSISSGVEKGLTRLTEFGKSLVSIFTNKDLSGAMLSVLSYFKTLGISIGSFVQSKLASIPTFFSTLFSNLKSARTNKIFDSIGQFFLSLSKNLKSNKIVKGLSTIFGYFTSFFGSLHLESITNLFGSFWRSLFGEQFQLTASLSKLQNVSSFFTNFKNAVSDLFKNNNLSSIWSSLYNTIIDAKNKIVPTLDSIGEALSNVDWGKATAIVLSLTAIPVILQIGAAFSAASKLFKGSFGFITEITNVVKKFGNIPDKIGKTFDSLTKAIDDRFKPKVMQFAEAAIRFSAAVLILAGALKLISTIPKEELIRSGIAIGGLAAGLTILVAVLAGMSSKGKFDKFNKASLGIISLVGAVAVLAGSLYLLKGLTPGDLELGVETLIGLMLAITVFATIFASAQPKLASSGKFFLSFSASIVLLVGAIKILSTIENFDLTGSLAAIGTLMAIMASFAIIKNLSKNSFGLGPGLLSMTISLLLMMRFLNMLGEDRVQGYIESAKRNIGLIAVIFGLLAALTILSRRGSKNSLQTGAAILAMSLSLNLIYGAVKRLGKLNISVLLKGTIAIGILLRAFGAFGKKISSGDGKPAKISAAIIAMSASLLLVYLAVKKLGSLELSTLAQGVLSVIALLGAFGTAMRLSSKTVKAGPILAMTTALLVLIAGLAVLTLYKPEELIPSVVVLSVVLIALGHAMQLAGQSQFDKKSIVVFGEALIALIGACAGLYLLKDIPWYQLLSSAGAIAGVLLAIGGCLRLIQTSSFSSYTPGSFIALASGLVSIFVIGTLLMAMTNRLGGSWQTMAGIAGSISAVLVAISAAMFVTQGIPFTAALNGLGGVLAWIAGLAIVFSLIGAVAEWTGLNDSHLAQVERIGRMIGGFVGSMFDEFNVTSTASLPQVAENLTGFIEGLSGFFDGVASIPDGFTSKMASLSSGLKEISKAEMRDAWAGFINAFSFTITGKDSDLKASMTRLGEGLQAFQEATKSINPRMLSTNMSTVVTMLDAFDQIPKERRDNWLGNIFDWFSETFAGKTDFDGFKTGMKEMGEALGAFAESTKGIKAASLSASSEAFTQLLGMFTKLPKTGPLIDFFSGTYEWSTISTGLEEFGKALSAYSDAVSGDNAPDAAAIEKSIEPAKKLNELLLAIPEAGGFEQKFSGEYTWGTLSTGLEEFGTALTSFSTIVTGSPIDVSAIEKSVQGATVLASLLDAVPEAGGFVQKFTGENSWATISTGLADFGAALKGYSDSISGENGSLDTIAMDRAAISAQKIIETCTSFRDAGMTNGEMGLLGSGLESFGGHLKGMSDMMVQFDTEAINTVLESLKSLQEAKATYEELGGELAESIVSKFQLGLGAEKSSAIAGEFISTATAAFSSYGADLQAVGDSTAEMFIVGFAAAVPGVQAAATSLGTAAKNGLQSSATGFSGIGVQAAQGFISGIASMNASAFAAGHSLGNSAANGVRSGLDVHSPSRVMRQIGEYAGEGLGRGMMDMASYVSSSASKMAEGSILSVSSIFDQIDSALNNQLTYNPVITPVLDLSALSYGASQLDNILNQDSTIRMNGQLKDLQSHQDVNDLLAVGRLILKEIQNGSDLYFDDGAFAGRINRRLGSL